MPGILLYVCLICGPPCDFSVTIRPLPNYITDIRTDPLLLLLHMSEKGRSVPAMQWPKKHHYFFCCSFFLLPMSVPKKKQIEDNEQNLCEQDSNSFSGMIPLHSSIAFFSGFLIYIIGKHALYAPGVILLILPWIFFFKLIIIFMPVAFFFSYPLSVFCCFRNSFRPSPSHWYPGK